jgi:hypothetical protein
MTFLYENFLASAKDFPAKDSEGFLDIDFVGCNYDLPAVKGTFSKGSFHKH